VPRVAAYTHLLEDMPLPDLLMQAEMVRELADHPAWVFVLEVIAEHERKMLARLLNETTKPEEIPRLRGLIAGLQAARDAADTIVSFAVDRERDAKRAIAAQEPSHV
jgi:hypothetical protein